MNDDDLPIALPPAAKPSNEDDDDDAPLPRYRPTKKRAPDDNEDEEEAERMRARVQKLVQSRGNVGGLDRSTALVQAGASALIALHIPHNRPAFKINGRLARFQSKTLFSRTTGQAIRIELNPNHLGSATGQELHDMLLHEIAHAIAGYRAGHGPQWCEAVERLGGQARPRCFEVPQQRVTRLQCRGGHVRCSAPKMQPQWVYFTGLKCERCEELMVIRRVAAPVCTAV